MSEPPPSAWREALTSVAAHVPAPVKDALRPVARRVHLAAPEAEWWAAARPLWARPARRQRRATARCNICGWVGEAFTGMAHCESAACPRCGSIARDRFLLWCFARGALAKRGVRILETSPRLDADYRALMRRWFDYRASDFDLSAHEGDIRLDLQDIELPTASIDVVLTPHVLEHVPDTDRALAELFRIVAPGGRVYLQVPLLQGVTGVPAEPEFHADNTPVFFRFGWDLTDRLRATGFEVTVLVTDRFRSWLTLEAVAAASNGDGFDIESLVAHARPGDVVGVVDDEQAAQLGFQPPYHFATWECRRP